MFSDTIRQHVLGTIRTEDLSYTLQYEHRKQFL